MFDYAEVHCHCLPGLDDGPDTPEEAVELCRSLADQGVRTVVATPHQLGSYGLTNDAARVREAVRSLSARLADEGIDIDVRPGGDVRVDENFLDLLDQDRILTVADAGRAVLLELPHRTFVEIGGLVEDLVGRGIVPVVTHPERHPHLQKQPARLVAWANRGAAVQITSGSLLGHFGPEAARAAWEMATLNGRVLVASDAHDVAERRPCLPEAAVALTGRLGAAAAKALCIDHPQELL